MTAALPGAGEALHAASHGPSVVPPEGPTSRPAHAGGRRTMGELRFAVRHEEARTVADRLDRRTRTGPWPPTRKGAVPVAEDVLGEQLIP